MQVLTKKEWAPYISNYLSLGWKEDNYEITSIEYSSEKIISYISLSSYFLPKTGVYHFSIPLAFNIIAQLGIIHGCLDNNIKKKSKEIYLREIQLKCKHIISSTKDIKIEIKVTVKRSVKNGFFYIGNISIGNNSFSGEAKYILPIE
ncbi:hypothetical protein [Polaribacter porphyrae]|uniref:Uncharacterized protein n=1 Tax=Polaribacter porphyrae TaxID=1137780 RepID=A0A2S7WT41_9FLAO|nr:hypothetical protein [Polaribacter porphyrae]PQJ80626.1 hypothetical protein BTO18_16225 [Polaribacter porphyrae]